jgi:hypothetical protein
VLADGQAEDAVGGGQGEAVDGGVVREDGLLGERELLEDGGVKDLLLLCESGVSEVCAVSGEKSGMSHGCRRSGSLQEQRRLQEQAGAIGA